LTNELESQWQEFEVIGEEKVRKNIGLHVYGDQRLRLANQWLAFRESSDSSEQRRKTLALAQEANDLARSASEAASESNSIARRAADSASLSAAAARTNNIIATLALIAATIAIAFSIIGMFIGK
jgi:hypothetical protein